LVSSAPLSAQDDWRQFESLEYGFLIRYPVGWVEDPPRRAVIVSLSGPKTAGPSAEPMSVWIVIPSFVSTGTSLEVWSVILEGVNGSIHRNQNFRMLGRSPVALDSHQGLIMSLNYDESPTERVVQLMLLVIDGTRGFIVSATTDERSPQRAEELATLEGILKSFRLVRR